MRIKLKRLVSLMLVLVMLFGMLPTAYAEETEQTSQNVSADSITEPTEGGEVEAAEPSEVVTEASEPTEVVTEASEPTEVVTEASEPTEVTAEVTEPTEAVTEATEPTEVATEATEPTDVATEATEPTEAVTEAAEPPEAATEPTESTEPSLPVSDPTADVESSAAWEATMTGVSLTGNPAKDLIAIAESQLGYRESSRNFVVSGEGEDITLNGYTRYGAWYGLPYGDWCAMFVSFCIEYAGIEDIPYGAACQTWIEALTEEGLYNLTTEDYEPTPGEIVFYDYDGDDRADHVGIVTEVKESGYVTIEGNYSNMVTYVERDESTEVLGYVSFSDTEEEPSSTWSTETVAGSTFTFGTSSVNPYAVATMSLDDGIATVAETEEEVKGKHYERAYLWLNDQIKLSFTYKGSYYSEDNYRTHGVKVNGKDYVAYCIDPGISTVTNYTGSETTWDQLPDTTKRAIGLTLLYGAPNGLNSSDAKRQLANEVATQIIIHEIMLGYRSNTPPYACTDSRIINRLVNCAKKGLLQIKSTNTYSSLNLSSMPDEYITEAYDTISNNLAKHWTVPSFATDDEAYSLAYTYTLKRQSDGTYMYECPLSGTDRELLSSGDVKLRNGNGLTFTVVGDKLRITAQNYFSGTKSCAWNGSAGAYKDVPNLEEQSFMVWSYQSKQRMVTHLSEGKPDPVPLYFNVKAEYSPSNMRIRKESDTGDVTGYEFYIARSGGGEWRAKTNSSGNAMQAEASANGGAYTVISTSDTTLEGFTAGTYDIMERLVTKGKDQVYPAEITIDIVDKNGKSISGDNWPKTYYPGNGKGTLPLTNSAGNGAAGTITIDANTGNARLNKIEFAASDLGIDKTITVTVKNQEYPAGLSLRKSSGTNGLGVANACFKLYRWSTNYRSHKTWYVKTNSSGVGYNATYKDGTYTITTQQVTDLTNGTYDFVEDLEAMGLAGIAFPTSWTVRVLDRNNEEISEETYYPGTTEGESITRDDNGNARLSQIEIEDMEYGARIVMEIRNEVVDGEARLIKTVTDGSAADTCFKLYRWGAGNGTLTSKTWYVKTDADGNGYKADYNNGTYTITKELPNIQNGKYDIIEDLDAMNKAGVFFPDSWTITVRDKDGNVVNTTTYYPGNDPGTSITKDPNGNPRLSGVEIMGLTDSGWVEMEINNAPWPAQAYIRKTGADGNVAGACFGLYNLGNGLNQYVITDETGEGYAAIVTTDEDGKKEYTKTEVRGFDGLTDGTYDFMEDLESMGVVGTMFPSSWTVTVRDKDGNVVNTKTYYPGDVEGQSITTDPNGNARLKKIKIEGITDGGWVEMEIENTLFKGEAHLKKTSIGGSAADTCFKLYRWREGVLPHYTWYVKTDENGIGYEATVNADGTLTITDKLPNITNGTYDILEDLVNMGVAGTVFPTSWTVRVMAADGTVVNSTTYTLDDPNGNIITVDADNNARLKQIRIEGLEDGGWVEMEITNEFIVGKISAEKVDVYGNHLAGVKFCLEWSADGITWAPVTAAVDSKVTPGSCSSEGLDENGCLITGEDGFVTFDGLDTTMYYRLTEVETVNGFSLLPDAVFEGKLPTEEDFVLSFKVIDETITLNTGSTELYTTVTIGVALMLLGLCAAMTAILPDKRRNIRR